MKCNVTEFIQETNSVLLSPEWGELVQEQYLVLERDETFGFLGSRSILGYFPVKANVIGHAMVVVRRAKHIEVAIQARSVLSAVQDALSLYQEKGFEIDHLPPIRAFHLEDGSIQLEWILENLRLGFVIDPKLEESSWFLVTNADLGDTNASGYLKTDNFGLIYWLIFYIVMYS